MYKRPVREFSVVKRCWYIQIFFGIIALLFSYFHLTLMIRLRVALAESHNAIVFP